MPNDESVFSQYKNFEFSNKISKLPVKIDVLNEEKFSGGFSTTIVLDEANVLKINRLVRVKPSKVGDDVEINDLFSQDHLASKGSDGSVVEKLTALRDLKNKEYLLISRYIGKYLPEFKGAVIVDSPRRVLEESALKDMRIGEVLPENVLTKIPEKETALMELWENVNSSGTLSEKKPEELLELYRDENFREEMVGFAQGALELLVSEGKLLDIYDRGGIRVRELNGSRSEVSDLDEIYELLRASGDERMVYPRNTTYADGSLKFYDIYPTWKVRSAWLPDREFLNKLGKALENQDFEEIDLLVTNGGGDTDPKLVYLTGYMVLLKKLGANLEDIPDIDF